MLVSICLAVKNASKYIVETLKSVQEQTYTDFECVIVDDHSTDNTVQLIYEIFSSKDTRFKLFVNCTDTDNPYIDAHNKSYEYASGKYLFRIDQDDVMMRDYIEFQTKFMEAHNDIDASCTNVIRCFNNADGTINKTHDITDFIENKVAGQKKKDGSTKESIDLFNKYNAWQIKNNSLTWCNQASCLRRSFYKATSPKFEKFKAGDYIFWWSVLAKGGKLYKHYESKLYYREHNESLSNQKEFKEGITNDYQIIVARYKAQAFRLHKNEEYPDGTTGYKIYKVFDNTVKYFEDLEKK